MAEPGRAPAAHTDLAAPTAEPALSEATAKSHVARIFAKPGPRGRAQAVAVAVAVAVACETGPVRAGAQPFDPPS
ncbi:hypothetical protein ACIRBZ_14440 [Streptomyces sp. NPDC094038]|uniref:hypothetical protein n=1 Tax=Streptomyces sp. NPDC094038 TaxID=3366055 RepID=UPI003827437C